MSDSISIKSIAKLVSFVIAVFGLAACNSGGGSDGASTPSSPPPPVSSPPPPAPPPPSPPPPPPPPVSDPGTVTVTGSLQYEFVPPNTNCQGLDFGSTFARPIRGATVQLVDPVDGSVVASTSADESGFYTFTNVPEETGVTLQVRAELKDGIGSTDWDVEVRDNFVDGGSDDDNPDNPPYRDGPLYVLDGGTFDTGTGTLTRNLVAESGWNASTGSYTAPRAAAPFAVLDAIYSGMRYIVDVDPGVDFDPLTAYWSVNNKLITSGTLDVSAGELTASFYRSGRLSELFLTGDAATDTEEYDDHVIVHEWGHYFEDVLSRTDSIGGPHAVGDRLDARLAFGEGWATAYAGMALDNPIYCDTGPAGAGTGFGIGAETGSYDARGWYDEISVLRFLYDLFDEGTDGGADTVSLGFAPIYNIMVGAQANTQAFTTIFSFASSLRSSLGDAADRQGLDDQLVREDMTPGFNLWGEGELNDANGGQDVFPLYTDVATNGTPTNVCMNNGYDQFNGSPEYTGNKLAQRRFLRFNVPVSSRYDVTVTTTTDIGIVDDPDDPRDQSDPDMFIFNRGDLVGFGNSGVANSETFTTQLVLNPGIHVADLHEFRYRDDESPANFPDRVCFDVTIAPN